MHERDSRFIFVSGEKIHKFHIKTQSSLEFLTASFYVYECRRQSPCRNREISLCLRHNTNDGIPISNVFISSNTKELNPFFHIHKYFFQIFQHPFFLSSFFSIILVWYFNGHRQKKNHHNFTIETEKMCVFIEWRKIKYESKKISNKQ